MDRATWKQMQQMFADTNKFVDMLHNLPWESGLDPAVIRAVERYLFKNKDGQLGVTGDSNQLDSAEGISLLVF